MPKTLTYIGYQSFSNTNISSITIPNGVISIGSNAFANTPLQSVDLGRVKYIENGAFQGTKLSNIVIPSSVFSIGVEAFAGNSFVSITIPDETFYLADHAFFRLPYDSAPQPLLLNCINMDFSKPRSIGFQALPVVKPCDKEGSWSNAKPVKKPTKNSNNQKPKRKKYSFYTHSPSKKPTTSN